MNVWEITPQQVENLQGGDGGAFRDFVCRVISAHMTVCGVPSAALSTDARNMADGGVDCQISQAAPNDPHDRLRSKTCWQYKATSHDKVTLPTLREEINKEYAAQLIKEGYAYRFCVADTITAEKKNEWEGVLKEEAKLLNPNAPAPQVLTSTCLARLASLFPSIVAAQIPVNQFLHLGAWGRSIVLQTKQYVPVNIWDGVAAQIKLHADFVNAGRALVLPIHADAGIGKTRLVYETLNQTGAARSLVLYTNDEESALNLAHYLANYASCFALLVVDECSQETRFKIEQCLRGNEGRVRVFTISNFIRALPNPEPVLQRMPDQTVENVLSANFPNVPDERRRAAVALAGGFVRIAADICQNDLAGGLASTDQYYRIRIPDDEFRKVVEAISLVKKVGFSGEVSKQFEDLCSLTGLNLEDAKSRAKKLKESPGFVAIGGRFFYVTPEAVAQVALQDAWKRWIEDDPAAFFKRIPESLLDAFRTRVAHSGRLEFRNAAAGYFNDWAAALTPADLVDKKKAKQLVALIDTDPPRFLPKLVELVEQATPEQLLADSNGSSGGWGARRDLVWLCERLSSFPEFFYDVERILFRLALHESEKGIGNNATAIWKHLFSIYLSGTSIPYTERVKLLEQKIKSQAKPATVLALDALKEIFDTHASRMLGPAVVAGRIPPPDWRPSTNKEYRDCFTAAFAQYEQILTNGGNDLKQIALSAIVEHAYWFLRSGLLDELRALLQAERITVKILPTILAAIDMFARFDAREKESKIPREYCAKVLEWKAALVPNDFHSRLVSVVGRPSYDFLEEPEAKDWRSKLSDLALELSKNPTLIEAELPWLTSEDAKSAGELGIELGKLDAVAVFFDRLVQRNASPNLAICRGYLLGLMQATPERVARVNSFLDELELANPSLAFDYASILPEQTNAFARWARMCDAGKIPAHAIHAVCYRLPQGISIDHLKQALPRLMRAISNSETNASGTALQLIHSWIDQHKRNNAKLPSDAELWDLIGRTLERATPHQTMEVYYWEQTLEVFAQINPALATKIACSLLDDDLSVEEHAEKVLVSIAAKHPDLVMSEVGEALLDKKTGWKLQIRGMGGLITAVPRQTVAAWLDKTGIEGARKIAGGLPRPFVDESGNPIVSPLTEEVLKRFGEDEKVVRAFVCGSGIRSYSGDIGAQHMQEAAVAAKFLNHPIHAIREWAKVEKHGSEVQAARWRLEDEERFI